MTGQEAQPDSGSSVGNLSSKLTVGIMGSNAEFVFAIELYGI